MAVDACVKPNFLDDGDDDDAPMVFKRTSTSSKQRSQVNSDIKKLSSQKLDGTSPSYRSPNGHTASATSQKGKAVLSSVKASTPNLSLATSKESNKLSLATPKESNSVGEKSNHSKSGVNDKENKSFDKPPPVEPKVESEDSDDDKPLSSRLSVPSKPIPRPNSVHFSKCPNSSAMSEKISIKKLSDDSEDEMPLSAKFQFKPLSSRLSVPSKPTPRPNSVHTSKCPDSSAMSEKISIKKLSDDSEDEMPLSAKLQFKSGGGSSVKKTYDSGDEDKPLSAKFKPNGSIKRESEIKSPKILNKRPLSDPNTPIQPSVKKPKPSEASASVTAKSKQVSVKSEPKIEDDDDDDVPIAQRMKAASDNKSQSTKKTITKIASSLKKTDKKSKKIIKKSKYSKSTKLQPSSGDGQKWTTLEHNGVIFPPPYKPHGVRMLYNGKPVDLTPEQEEVATMFAVMKDTDYATKQKFLDNFWNDWKPILGKNHIIKKIELCDFTPIYDWHQAEKEKKKQMSTEEKKALKEEKMKQEEKYTWAIVDGVKEKIGNFRVEPPALFRGRGEHPKMGKLKKRIRPSDITINIGKGTPIPECPIPGERWKEVKHDNTVTWLAFWNDPINPKEFKYVFLSASSALKGQSDKEKYEKARLLKDYIHTIRSNYTKDFVNKDVTKRQIAVATYLIDKLALRAGNEKDEDEADTVGCCTLKVENVELIPPYTLKFDFYGKDSIRYLNSVEVEPPVYKAIGQFQVGKEKGDDLFDKLDTSKLNAHLKELMPGLTAKVFRTYNASYTLDDMLTKDTKGGDVAEKMGVYQTANKQVAELCNHQRSISKSHDAQVSRLVQKRDEIETLLDELKTDLARAKKGKPPLKDADGKIKKNLNPEALERKIAQATLKMGKIERDVSTKEALKTIALGTSKINYLDPRITVAWCKRHEVPIEKIFNKSLLAKFAWAMDVDPTFRF